MKDVEIGVQTYTYRQFDLAGIVRELDGTGITALEIWPKHLGPDAPDEEKAAARKMLADAGIRVCGVGVCRFADETEGRAMLSFAADLGADYVSIDVDAEDADAKDMLVRLAKECRVLLGIHNHGPGHHYDTAESVAAACEGYDNVLGACVDTGHFLRVGQGADYVIRTLGKRVNAVHLKDFIDAETEVVPGTGKLDYAAALKALEECTDFDGALVIEYEADPDDPTPSMRETVAVLRKALAGS